MRGNEIVAEGRGWLDTPWRHQQSRKGVGTDCIGFVGGVALALGIPEAIQWANDSRWKGYGRTPDPRTINAACSELLDEIQISEATIGDILLMRFRNDPPQHFAFVSRTDPMHILHAYAQARKVVENIVDATWASRIVKAYRFK